MSTMANGTNRSSTPGKLNGTSNIPLRRTSLNRTNSNASTNSNPSSPSKIPVTNTDVLKWKQKYEEVDHKRKDILIEKEKTSRRYNDLKKNYDELQNKHDQLETELFEKNEEYARLQTASKNLYKEYEMLKNQYETETHAMSRALKDASQWYKENKELKRKTMLLIDKDEGVDEGDSNEFGGDADIENLNKTIKQLSEEVAELQTELDSLKHTEYQTTEQNCKLMEDLEKEKERNVQLEQDLADLKKENAQILRISDMMKKELQELKRSEEEQRNNAVVLRRDAEKYKKERNVLAHQSTFLLEGLNNDSGDCLIFLQEIEQLKRTVEEERTKHYEEMNSLQEKMEEFENNQQIEILEERLKLVESELQEALSRAQKAEEALKAPPAPPPPPLPPLIENQPPVVPIRVKRRSRGNILELADAIGVKETIADGKKAPVGVNDDIINAIKEGKFTLKKAKNGSNKGEVKKEKESSRAVSELLNILGNLRRAPKKRQSQIFTEATST